MSSAYTDLASLKAWLGISVTTYDSMLTQALNSASRAIDNYCHRRFWLDPTAVIRTFASAGSICLEFPDDGIGDLTDLVVATDLGGDGTFETTWAAGDYELLPVNAPHASPDPEPWTAIRSVTGRAFPAPLWTGRSDRVQITARWGWPQVPDPVVQACLIKAAALFHRKDSPQGIAGFGDFGAVRLSRREDTDVCNLLDPYRWLVCA